MQCDVSQEAQLLQAEMMHRAEADAKPSMEKVTAKRYNKAVRAALTDKIAALPQELPPLSPSGCTLAPPTGAWADRSDRRRASRVARLAQILGTALGVLGVASLVYDGSQENYAALSLVLLGGAVASVAAVVSKNAPKKDWAPALFDGFERRLFFPVASDAIAAATRRG